MYQIYCDDVLIYDPRIENLQVIEPVLELGLNKTGSLTFQISTFNHMYNKIQKLKSEIKVYSDNELIFNGRVLNDDILFNKVKNVECEGELSYLIDTIQRNGGTLASGGTLNDLITSYINNHNQFVEDKKKFNVGNINLSYSIEKDYDFKDFNYKTTQDCFKNLINIFGGYLVCRHENNTKYIDYIDNNNLNLNTQIIEFGKNIIDMTQFTKADDVATALIVKGSSIDLTSVGEFTEGSIKHDANSDFIYDIEAVEKYGWIFKYIQLEDVINTETLKENAIKQLNYYTKPVFSIELTAIDLHLLNVNVESIKIGDKIRVLSIPHRLDLYMIVNKITINMGNPENTKVELIHEDRIDSPTMTSDKILKIDDNLNNFNNEFTNINDKLIDYNNELTDFDNNLINFDNKLTDFDTKLGDYDNKFNEYDIKTNDFNDKINNLNDNMGNTIDSYLKDNLGTAIGDYLNNGGTIDLSGYAKEDDVNNAFNELATLLNEV